VEKSEAEQLFDLAEWEKAVSVANQNMTPDEESWASWKCEGGPHQQPLEVATKMSVARSVKIA
jgi:hypothetical protein